MTITQKGFMVAAIHCLLALSVTGKLLYDRATCPRVWVKATNYYPDLFIRGRYRELILDDTPETQWHSRIHLKRALFFLPEHMQPFEREAGWRRGPDLWVEVTIPKSGPPRPIQLAIKKDGVLEPIHVN